MILSFFVANIMILFLRLSLLFNIINSRRLYLFCEFCVGGNWK